MGIDGTSHAIPIPGACSSNTKPTFPPAGILPKSRSGCSSIKATVRSIKSYCGSSVHCWKERRPGEKRFNRRGGGGDSDRQLLRTADYSRRQGRIQREWV